MTLFLQKISIICKISEQLVRTKWHSVNLVETTVCIINNNNYRLCHQYSEITETNSVVNQR